MNAKVEVERVFSEYLFEWFYLSITHSSGEGSGVICCGNPTETADEFIKWYKRFYKKDKFLHPKHVYGYNDVKVINFHDSNENFMFTNKETPLSCADVNFFVKENCPGRDGFEIEGLSCSRVIYE